MTPAPAGLAPPVEAPPVGEPGQGLEAALASTGAQAKAQSVIAPAADAEMSEAIYEPTDTLVLRAAAQTVASLWSWNARATLNAIGAQEEPALHAELAADRLAGLSDLRAQVAPDRVLSATDFAAARATASTAIAVGSAMADRRLAYSQASLRDALHHIVAASMDVETYRALEVLLEQAVQEQI